jgi:hypothetical protein
MRTQIQQLQAEVKQLRFGICPYCVAHNWFIRLLAARASEKINDQVFVGVFIVAKLITCKIYPRAANRCRQSG